MRRLCVVLLTGLVLLLTPAGVSAAAAGGEQTQVVQVPAADSPSPTLGSTANPGANPPGDADADASDFDQVPLAVGSFVFLALLVGGSLVFYLWRRNRQSKEERTG
ncbi:hypothetical protein [Kribbella sp. CA-247076]|uniref:hypothetical protein n=1 Tax=Kribbella sp. CA-247076 TaxID=3239941 RepID=UPI003D8DD20C